MKRTFIAVKVDPGERLTGALDILKGNLKNEAVRWVDISKLHITLSFLGDTSEDTISEVSTMLREICDSFDRFSFTLSHMGVFRNINDPKVIWAGIEHSEGLIRLNKEIKTRLDDVGIVTEEREFRPHLTLGRIKFIKNKLPLEKLLAEYKDFKFQDVSVTEVIFYESILQQTGPLYLPIKIFRLA